MDTPDDHEAATGLTVSPSTFAINEAAIRTICDLQDAISALLAPYAYLSDQRLQREARDARAVGLPTAAARYEAVILGRAALAKASGQ